jgi:hypothetical protein
VEASKIPKEMLEGLEDFPSLEPEEIANAVLYVLGAPPHVQVSVRRTNHWHLFVSLIIFFVFSCSYLISFLHFFQLPSVFPSFLRISHVIIPSFLSL